MSGSNQKPIDLEPGYYTVVYPNGDHRTLRIKKVKNGFLEGQKIIGYLTGTDNTSSYTYFGVIGRGQLHFWNSWMAKIGHDQIKVQRVRRAVEIINADPEYAGKAYALASGNCFVCNRLLTEPISISFGIGPECRKNRQLAA